jgi:outer membrane biosynthesis protein TonB
MKRPLTLIVGTAAGAILVAGVGASAHSGGFSLFRPVGMQQSQFGDEASGARLESPEPSDSPEASPTAEPTAEPTEKPEPSPTAEPTEKPEVPESDNETKPTPTAGTGDHEGDGGSGSGGGSGHHD